MTTITTELPDWPRRKDDFLAEDRSDFIKNVLQPFYVSLGLDSAKWREEQAFDLPSLTKVRLFGMETSIPETLRKQARWACRVEREQNQFLSLYVGDFLWAATIFSKGNHVLNCLDENIRLLRLSGGSVAFHSLLRFRSLENLDLRNKILPGIPRLTGLSSLAVLRFGFCESVTDLSPLVGLSNLKRLYLRDCKLLSDLSPLAEHPQLEEIDLSGCGNLAALSPLSGLRNLRSLVLADCKALADIAPLASLHSLESLTLRNCDVLSDISSLSRMRILKSLDLSRCGNLADLSPLSGLRNLRSLELRNCELLSDLSPLAEHPQLEELDLSGCGSLDDLSPLSALRNLRILDLSGCKLLSDLSPLADLTQLEEINLSGCGSFADLSALFGLRNLRSLDLSDCKLLSDLSSLSDLTELEEIKFRGCNSIQDLAPLSALAGLKTLDLSSCEKIFDLGALKSCLSLERVVLTDLKRITSLEPLRALEGLRELGGGETRFSQLHFHPGIVAELLAHAAWRRRDITCILEGGEVWIRESCDFENEEHPCLEQMSSTLAVAFSLLGKSALGDSLESLLDRHPEFTSAPWKAWFGGTISESGFDLYRQRVERVPLPEMTSGAIGGACLTLPLQEQLDWSRQWLADLEKSRLGDAKTLLPAAPEVCLAYARSGDRQALKRWLEAFTDPSDPAALDPVHAALAKFQIGGGDLDAAGNHAHAIHSPAARDPVLGELVIHLAASDEDLASASLLLIEDQALRIDLAKKLVAKASASEVLIHRCIVAAGESPQAVADLITALPQSARSELVVQLSKKLQTDRRTTLLGIADELRRQADRLSAQALEVD